MRVRIAIVSCAAACCWTVQASAQDSSAFYDENCAACHTIGGGPQGGPDLKGVTARRDREWLVRFLLDPAAFESDPEVIRMIKEADGMTMPSFEGMTREMAEALLKVIEQRSAGEPAPSPAAEPASAAADRPFTPADVERGRALFTGASRLSASGPACAGCHDARLPGPGGGRLGPGLATAHTRLGGRTGLTAWLGATPTPLMRALYRAAPLTDDEVRSLVAFLEQPDDVPATSAAALLAALGLGGSLLVLAGAALTWRRRFRAVRRPLVARANPTSPPRFVNPEP
jgi:mono/diheme cytochrome c family protein